MPTEHTVRAAAGWYADPTVPERLRYWDGERWSAHTFPVTAPAAEVLPEPAFVAAPPPGDAVVSTTLPPSLEATTDPTITRAYPVSGAFADSVADTTFDGGVDVASDAFAMPRETTGPTEPLRRPAPVAAATVMRAPRPHWPVAVAAAAVVALALRIATVWAACSLATTLLV